VVAALVLSRQPDPDSFTIRIVIATAVQFGFVAAVAARLRRGLPEATTTSGAQWRGRRAETSGQGVQRSASHGTRRSSMSFAGPESQRWRGIAHRARSRL